MLTGWIDAGGAAAAAMAAARGGVRARTAGHLRRRHVHRLPRPPADDGAPRRASTPVSCGPTIELHVGTTRDGRDVLAAQRSRAGHGVAQFADAVGARRAARRQPMVALGAYPFADPAHPCRRGCRRTSPSAECSSASLPYLQELRRRARRDAAPCSSTPARHAASPRSASGRRCRTTSARWRTRRRRVALLDGLHDVAGLDRRRRGDATGDDHPAGAARPARRRQRGAQAMVTPARGALRRTPQEQHRPRSARAARCRPATSSPPSSSGSCATRTDGETRLTERGTALTVGG